MIRRAGGPLPALWLVLVCLFAAFFCAPARGLDRDRRIAQFHHTAWTIKDGAPADIWALAQTLDGYLWLGTGAGLYRFDGVRFERFQASPGGQFRSDNITALTALPSGELWIGFYFGGASVLKDGRLTHYTEREGMPPGTVFRFAQDKDGVLWAATTGGLARFEEGQWQRVGGDWGYPGRRADWVHVDTRGTLWVMTGETLVFLSRGSRRFEPTGEQVGVHAVLAQASDGALWMSDTVGGTRALPDFSGGQRQANPEVDRARTVFAPAKRMHFDRDGSLWATDATRGGIYRVPFPERPGAGRNPPPADVTDFFTQEAGLTADIAVPLLEDREGNIWVGTNLGLNRFRYNDIVVEHQVPSTSPSGYALAAGDRGAVWVASTDVLLNIERDATRLVADSPPEITSACRDTDGSLWLGGPGGLWRLTDGRLVATALPAGSGSDDVQAMTVDRSGGLWVSIERQGVFRLENGVWERNGDREELPRLTAIAATADAQGRVWFGYPDSTVAMLDGARVRLFSADDGLQVGNVTTIHAGARHVLIGGELGLARFEGDRFRSLPVTRVEALGGISGIVETPDGEIWLNGHRGIARLSTAQLIEALEDADHRLQYRLFDFEDGLPGIAQQVNPVPTAIRGSDGRLWFATNHGVVWVDPARSRKNELPPPVSIRSIGVDGATYAPATSVQLPEGAANLLIDYTAPSLSIPERVRFRHRLDGFDTDWQDAGTRRQAAYTHLDPGRYRFRVIAANNDGVWNQTGATLEFVIPPTFLQSKWFLALCAAAAIGVLWLLYILRLRQVSARLHARLEERLVERERIARELHDTLLQGIQGLILRFQAATERIPAHEPARALMEKALDRADEVLAEGRDRVLDLRAPEEPYADLSEALAALAAELSEEFPVEFRVVTEGEPRELDPIVRDETYRIGREALLNAFHHARAREIEAEITYDTRELRLRFRDDGRGVDSRILEEGGRPGHWGLCGMRERAGKIGAHLDVWSRVGSGTEVELRVPSALAYRGETRRFPWNVLHNLIGAR